MKTSKEEHNFYLKAEGGSANSANYYNFGTLHSLLYDSKGIAASCYFSAK